MAVDCFGVYDMNSDGYIVRDEMFLLLRSAVVKVGFPFLKKKKKRKKKKKKKKKGKIEKKQEKGSF